MVATTNVKATTTLTKKKIIGKKNSNNNKNKNKNRNIEHILKTRRRVTTVKTNTGKPQ